MGSLLALGPMTAIFFSFLLRGSTLLLFCNKVMVWSDIGRERLRCSLLHNTEAGIFDHDTMLLSSISPRSKRPSNRRTTCLSTSASVSAPYFTASGTDLYIYWKPHSTSVPANTPLAAAFFGLLDTLWLFQKSVTAPQSDTTRYLNPHSSRRM